MSTTEDRIVRMQFDNAQFKKGAVETQKSLADLNKSVDAAGKGKGLLDLNNQMSTVSVTASKMAVATTAALATIVSQATNAALSLGKAMTLDPISQGFLEYENLLTKQNVIMNATGKSASYVKGILNELNTYSDQTIYSFANMTDSITKFVNAGVDLPTAVVSMKGIANAAAFAGATTQEANRAMYAFSQSMQTGFIMLNDWMQIENANMGTIQFKEELLKAGEAAGTLTKQGKNWVTESGRVISATKGWRDGLQDQWATTEVLNSALGKYADTNTKLGKQAFESATEVRTFTAFMDTLKESLGSGWSQIFTALIGNLKQATTFWTGVSSAVGHTVENIFDFGVTALKTWRKMGGFEKTIQGFKNILAPFGAILEVIGEAWGEAFPGTDSGAGKALYGLSAGFEAVTRPLQWLADLIRGTTPVLTVFFQIIKIIGTVLGRAGGQVANFVSDLLGLGNLKPPSAGGFVDFIQDIARAIAEAVDKIDELISKGASLGQAFGAVNIDLPNMPAMPSLPSLGGDDKSKGAITSLSGGIKDLTKDVFGLNKAADETEQKMMFTQAGNIDTSAMGKFGAELGNMAENVSESGDETQSVFAKMGDAVKSFFGFLGDLIGKFSFEDLIKSFNLAIMATFMISLARMFNTFSKGLSGFAGIGGAIQDTLGQAGAALKSFQTQAQAKLVLNIAIAIGILALSLIALSFVPADKLALALGALGAVMWGMNKMMKSLMETLGDFDPASVGKMSGVLVALGFAMMSLGVAMLFLAGAFLIFNFVDVSSVAKGLVTMGVALELLKRVALTIGPSAGTLVAAGAAMLMVGAAMVVLAGAMLLFKLIDPADMAKAGVALLGMTIALGVLGKLMSGPQGAVALIAAGVAMAAASVGMLVLANALLIFQLVKWESLAKAGVALVGLALGLTMMIAGAPAGAVLPLIGLGIIALALGLLALEKVSPETILKMVGAMAGLAVGLTILTPILYIAGPALLMFGAAMLAIGVGFFAFTAGLTAAIAIMAVGGAAISAFAIAAAVAFTAFLQTLAAEAPVMKEAILTILQTIIDTIVEAVPMVIDGIKRLWEGIKKELSSPEKGKQAGNASRSWIVSMADAIKEKTPLIVRKGAEIIIAFLKGLQPKMAKITAAGIDLIVEFIKGVGRKVDDVVDAATEVVVKFIEGIGDGLDDIVDAGVQLIADFLHDLADAIREGSDDIGGGIKDVIGALKDVGVDMIQGLINGIGSMLGNAVTAIGSLAQSVVDKARSILKIKSPSRIFMDIGKFVALGLAKGIQKHAAAAIVSTASMITGQIALANQYVTKFIQELDQKAIAAQARAQGLARAAQRAAKAAEKTNSKRDDKLARNLTKKANQASKEAKRAEKDAQKAEKAQDRKEAFQDASLLKKAEMRAQDAQRQIDAAKNAEQNAAAARAEAKALEAEAKKEGYTAKQRKDFRKEAERLREEAKEQAKRANKLLNGAKNSAADALKWQQLAGEEAAKLFQERFDAEARADQEEEEFSRMTDAQKAQKRREQAAELERLAAENLAEAKRLAFTDLEAANALAETALQQAEMARDYIDEATDLERGGGGTPSVDLQITEAAALAFEQYRDLFEAATAAAAAQQTIFNQYNTSPEALSATEIYRQTNNQINWAAENVLPAAS